MRSPSVGKIILRMLVNEIAKSTASTQKFLILSRFHAPS
ncbi:Leucine-responsive regulatory protein [Burkholderia cenocepacia KC-01]|nr:Leucine-responsive regulatory protein [Burkholderia cenocepacia KC-01]